MAAEKTEISRISIHFQFKRAAEKTELLTNFPLFSVPIGGKIKVNFWFICGGGHQWGLYFQKSFIFNSGIQVSKIVVSDLVEDISVEGAMQTATDTLNVSMVATYDTVPLHFTKSIKIAKRYFLIPKKSEASMHNRNDPDHHSSISRYLD